MINHAPTLSEVWVAMAFDTIKYLYKYYFNSPFVTLWLSRTTLWRSKTYCLALQKRRFCKVKAAVLQRKTYAFGKPKKNTRFSVKIFRGRSKGETVCANRRFLLATEATQGHVGASFITFLYRRCRPFGGYRLAAFAVRNVMNHSPTLPDRTTKNRKTS